MDSILFNMAQKIPVIRNTNLSYFIPQVATALLLVSLLYGLGNEHYFLLGLALYFLLSFYLKVLIPKWHRKGIFALKKGKLDLAVLAFERSYAYFHRYPWIDKYRAFTLLSSSRYSYIEMALMNMIYCLEQMGDHKTAKKYHQRLKQEFPDNTYA